MRKLLEIVLGLFGVMLAASGIMWAFLPESNFETYKIAIDSIAGLSMVQTDIGAPLIAGGILLLLFAFKGNEWFWPMLIFGGSYLVVRALTLLTIGYDSMALFGVVFEAIVLVLMFALKRMREQ